MQSLASMNKGLAELYCIVAILAALYLTLSKHSSDRSFDFICCGLLAGVFLFGLLEQFFGPPISVFGSLGFIVVTVGLLIGGVIGILVPKSSSAISLGVLVALFLSMALDSSGFYFGGARVAAYSTIFACTIPLSLCLSMKVESLMLPIRGAIMSGLLVVQSLDVLFNGSFCTSMYKVLLMTADSEQPSQIGSEVGQLIAWIVVAAASFLLQAKINDLFRRWSVGSYEILPSHLSAEFKHKGSEQKTFSFPDALEFNYFDPDNLPLHFQAHGLTIFNTVQDLASKHGFQVDNSRNQAEHLLMMLANECRQGEHILTEPPNRLHAKLFANYKLWCDRVGSPPQFAKKTKIRGESQIQDILLYLLIWGEAANLRHTPECICFLFHKSITLPERELLYPGFFLDHIISPVYEVYSKAITSQGDHETKKIYDDFNEFFWSPTCLNYEIDHSTMDSFNVGTQFLAQGLATTPKTYVEKRSYIHGILSFHRVLEWHSLLFTILAVLGLSMDLIWTTAYTLQAMSIIFIEINIFGITWICIEVWLHYSTKFSNPTLCGYLLRLLMSYVLLVYQALYFSWSFESSTVGASDDYTLSGSDMRSVGDPSFWWWQYVWISVFALSIYFIESLLCWVPSFISSLLCWNNDVVQSVLNICYPFSQLYVGKKIHIDQSKVFVYIFYWLSLIAWKGFFGYNYITNPITVPSIELYDDYMNFLDVPFLKTVILMFIWWVPHYMVFLIDLSIWYSLWSAFVGGIIALFQRQGAVRDTDTLREHFMRAPLAFCQRIMPSNSAVGVRNALKAASQSDISSIESKKAVAVKSTPVEKGYSTVAKRNMSSNDLITLNATKSGPDENEAVFHEKVEGADNRFSEFLDVRTQRWGVFAKFWNEFISNLRRADLISNSERDTYSFNYFDWLTKPVYLPLFQTVSCVEEAVKLYIQSHIDYNKETKPQNKLLVWEKMNAALDVTSKEAIGEAWELTAHVLTKLFGSIHSKDIIFVVNSFNRWFASDDIYSKFSPENLSSIINHLSNIVGAVKGCTNKRKKSPIVTPEVVQQSITTKFAESSIESNASTPKNSMKKSVSTGFLSGLQDRKQSNSTDSKKFTTLEPFRKKSVLNDLVRDKIREEIQALVKALRNAFRPYSGTAQDVKDVNDRLTLIISIENGFIWNDMYASMQLDAFAADPHAPDFLTKLHGLFKLRQNQVELRSMEARRRINFFVNSLFMDMPNSTSLRYSKDFTVMTPFFSEDVLLTKNDLEQKNEDGVTTLLYLQTLYKLDWENFLQRVGLTDDQLIWSPKHIQATRMWASLRGQTLYRTVEGMMQSETAVRLMGELEQLSMTDIEVYSKLKFSYVVACQIYGKQKNENDPKAEDIEFLLASYPNLRIAYIDAVRSSRDMELTYYSVLIKYDNIKVKEVYRVKLPGNPVLGEGKPENQNHAIIFTRGRYLQAIDMNQDGYFEEAIKMRNLLEEFDIGNHVIVGFREHIFTGSVSSVANYMALQETSFVTLGQRVLTEPLHIRQHYGHPDVFDKMFVMTEGGMSKASRGINLSEDVFAGFNATIRGHSVGFKEYIQVGKGRDVGLQQTYKFEAKLAQGNAEQMISRDMHRLCERLDFFRLLSFYYGGIGHYVANAMIMITLIIVVYFMLALAVFDQEGVDGRPMQPEGPIQLALAGMGLLQTMPLIMALVVEKGVINAAKEIGFMFLSGGPLYFIIQIQTKSYFFQQTVLSGGASYKATGRGFVTRHCPFDENYRFFAASHIYLGIELMVALILYKSYSVTHQYLGLTWSLWLVVVSFVFGPFWFNPLSFETSKVHEDYDKWCTWMSEKGGTADQSWESWYKEETSYISKLTFSWKIFLLMTKCLLWVILGVGLIGPEFFKNGAERDKFSIVFVVIFIMYIGNWVITKTSRSISYATRRFASLFLNFLCIAVMVFLFRTHKKYFLFSFAFYYFGSSASFASLLSGIFDPSFLYKMHDYIIGHFLFFILYILSIIQLGILQTWLLYHNALSHGVAIEDILKYARRSKEISSEDAAATIAELRSQLTDQGSQLVDQERLLRSIMQTLKASEVQMTERTGLLSGPNSSGGGTKEYGTSSVPSPRTFAAPSYTKPAPSVPLSIKPQQIHTAAGTIEVSVSPALKPVLRATSESKTRTDTNVMNILSTPQSAAAPPSLPVPKTSSSTSKQEPTGLDLEIGGGGSFVFKQPDAFPKRG